MSLDRSDVEQTAHLARLQIDAADMDAYSNALNRILELVDQMQAVDTTAIQPLAHPLDAVQRLRRDEVSEPNQRDTLLALAPATEAGLFLVPKVIE